MKNMKVWVKRAVRTFGQTAGGYALTAITAYASGGINLNDISAFKTTIIGFVVSAIAAGLAAVMNMKESE